MLHDRSAGMVIYSAFKSIAKTLKLKVKTFINPSLRLADHLMSKRVLACLISPNLRARVAFAVGRSDIDDREELYRFWRQRNPAEHYFFTPPYSHRSQTILKMLGSRIRHDFTILEVGCGAGRNLNHLYRSGFKRLAGIEISAAAVEKLRHVYSQLSSININVEPAEDVLQHYKSGSFDVVFTMAMLEHIHPLSKNIFAEIARVARRYVLAVEPRYGNTTHRQYPWNIIKEFESVGLKLIDKKSWSELWPVDTTKENEWQEDVDYYDAMLFEIAAL